MINHEKIKSEKCHPPPFKKTCPWTILPPPFLKFSESSGGGRESELHSCFKECLI